MTTAEMNRLATNAAQEAERLEAEAAEADQRASTCHRRAVESAPGQRESHVLDALVAEDIAYWKRDESVKRRKVAALWASEAKKQAARAA